MSDILDIFDFDDEIVVRRVPLANSTTISVESSEESGEEDTEEEQNNDQVVPPEPTEVWPIKLVRATDASSSEEEEEDDVPVPPPVASKQPAGQAKKTRQSARKMRRSKLSTPKNKTHYELLLEAMEELDEEKRSGVSMSKILKSIMVNTELNELSVKFHVREALKKAVRDEVLVKVTGRGLSGSVNYSTIYRQKLREDRAEALKAEKEKGKPKKAPAPKKDINLRSSKPATKPRTTATAARAIAASRHDRGQLPRGRRPRAPP